MKLVLKSEGIHTEKILIDGKKMTRVTHMEIIIDGRKQPKVILELLPKQIEVDGEFEVFNSKNKDINELIMKIQKFKNKAEDIASFNGSTLEYCEETKELTEALEELQKKLIRE